LTFTYSGKEDVAAAVASSELIAELRTHKSIRLNVYKDFSDIVNIKYDGNEEEINKNEDNDFDRVMYLGLIAWKKEEDGYEIIHDGKPADKRILKKLGKIAYIFSQFDSYPKINGTALIPILNKTLGQVDKRTKRKYRKTILDYCNIDESVIERCSDTRLGDLDVSRFVKRIPMEYVVE